MQYNKCLLQVLVTFNVCLHSVYAVSVLLHYLKHTNCSVSSILPPANIIHCSSATKGVKHGEIIYGGTRWIEDDRSATFSEYIFLFPACLMISHWLTKNAELNSVF